MHECDNCWESFEPDNSDAGEYDRFCSEDCEDDYWYDEDEGDE